MADNVTLNAGAGGAVIATDDDTTAHHQYVKMEWGGDGTFTKVSTGAGAVPIQDGGNSLTVDNGGTFAVQAAQSGTWTVQPGNTANTTAWKVDGSAVTQPVSGTVSVTGVATSAKQDTAQTALDAIKTAVEILDNTVAGTELQVDVLTMPTTAVSQSGTWTVQPGNTANTTPWLTTPTPATSGGLSIYRTIDLDESEEEVKASAGQLFGWYLYNAAASARYLKFYNATAANVTVGSTTPVLTIPVAAGAAANVEFSNGIAFGTAISVAVTTGLADASSAEQTSGRIGATGGFPNSVMSAPATKVRPAQARTIAPMSLSSLASAIALTTPSRTAWPAALTGGLSIRMTPTAPSRIRLTTISRARRRQPGSRPAPRPRSGPRPRPRPWPETPVPWSRARPRRSPWSRRNRLSGQSHTRSWW